jgi:hypothetical protein
MSIDSPPPAPNPSEPPILDDSAFILRVLAGMFIGFSNLIGVIFWYVYAVQKLDFNLTFCLTQENSGGVLAVGLFMTAAIAFTVFAPPTLLILQRWLWFVLALFLGGAAVVAIPYIFDGVMAGCVG